MTEFESRYRRKKLKVLISSFYIMGTLNRLVNSKSILKIYCRVTGQPSKILHTVNFVKSGEWERILLLILTLNDLE